MSHSEDQSECPLCMESLDLDDIYFFPCTCGYQICRFCWHRIRTNENGLCPACRKLYSEDPAQFKPLTDDELTKIKKERRQKETQRKQKSAESRKHLANIRVVQKNLVFVVGLSQRLSDADVLRRPEYFGKFGKIHKVVINQSTSYVGNQGPSSSAYVTYFKAEDALTAIKAVNNLQIDGKTLKASLGTTKYCSHFLKGTQCQKQDCMYLHDLGDETASFTKEDIQQGKHLKYEQRLFEQLSGQSPPSSSQSELVIKSSSKPKEDAGDSSSPESQSPVRQVVQQASPPVHTIVDDELSSPTSSATAAVNLKNQLNMLQSSGVLSTVALPCASSRPSIYSTPPEHLSLFSNSGFTGRPGIQPQPAVVDEQLPVVTEIADSIPVSSCTDWQEAFGFSSTHGGDRDDDLGFDPWNESAKALADLIEREKATEEFHRPVRQHQPHHYQQQQMPVVDNRSFPARFQQNGYSTTLTDQVPQSRILNLMRQASMPTTANHSYVYPEHAFPSVLKANTSHHYSACQQPSDVLNMREWQDELKALLPNINISFGTPASSTTPSGYPLQHRSYLPTTTLPQYGHEKNNWAKHSSVDISWDPAIINRGANILDSNHDRGPTTLDGFNTSSNRRSYANVTFMETSSARISCSQTEFGQFLFRT